MKKLTTTILLSAFALLSFLHPVAFGTPIPRTAAGNTPGSIQPTVNLFFSDIGGVDNGSGNSFATGRRELNFDLIPDNFAIPNRFPRDFFNSNVPRGAAITSGCNNDGISFSADSNNPTGTPIVFSNLNAGYLGQFITYNSQRIANPANGGIPCTTVEIRFFIPGTNIPATVKGFGAVFTDIDFGSSTIFTVYDLRGNPINSQSAPSLNAGLSFGGLTYTAPDERIASVKIFLGTHSVNASDGGGVDVVALCAIFYGEPRASQFHSGDFDGDGASDSAIFRPASGQWFTFNSGSSTVSISQWGSNGDIPIDGDFDGDSMADLCIFRPSDGSWWFRKSSDATTRAFQFGQSGDRPVVGDYDKDGKSDIAFWRPSNGNYYVLRSSTNFGTFYGYGFGQVGDIPVQGAAQ